MTDDDFGSTFALLLLFSGCWGAVEALVWWLR